LADASDATQVLSRAAFERLRDELEELQIDGRKAVAERLQRARELGDLSENAEYHATKDEQAIMEARIRKIEHLLKHAQIVEGPVQADTAIAGTVVSLRPVEPEGDIETYLLAASSEERAKTVRTVTVNSPLGKAIGKKHVGDVVKYQAPGGTFTYEVVKIEPWDGKI